MKEDNISERVYTIREGDTLMLQCLVTGHPRPQVSPTLASHVPPLPLPPHSAPHSGPRAREEAAGAGGKRWMLASKPNTEGWG